MTGCSNTSLLLNLIEEAIVEEDNLKGRTIYFSNEHHCLLITTTEVRIIPELASDHEEADTKLLALVKSTQLLETDMCHGSFSIWGHRYSDTVFDAWFG